LLFRFSGAGAGAFRTPAQQEAVFSLQRRLAQRQQVGLQLPFAL